jgi:hypothetical protein
VRRAWSSSAGGICSTGGGVVVTPSPARPVGGEHGVDDAVEHAAPDALDLAQRAFLAEPEPLGDRAAARVLDRGLDEDAIEPPRREGVVDVRADGFGHRPSPLLVVREPVADARLAVRPVDAVRADHPHDAPVGGHDRRLQPVVVADLPARGADEGEHVGGLVLVLDPGHPALEVGAIGVDQRDELVGVGLLEQAQGIAVGQLAAEHQTFASNASSAS